MILHLSTCPGTWFLPGGVCVMRGFRGFVVFLTVSASVCVCVSLVCTWWGESQSNKTSPPLPSPHLCKWKNVLYGKGLLQRVSYPGPPKQHRDLSSYRLSFFVLRSDFKESSWGPRWSWALMRHTHLPKQHKHTHTRAYIVSKDWFQWLIQDFSEDGELWLWASSSPRTSESMHHSSSRETNTLIKIEWMNSHKEHHMRMKPGQRACGWRGPWGILDKTFSKTKLTWLHPVL